MQEISNAIFHLHCRQELVDGTLLQGREKRKVRTDERKMSALNHEIPHFNKKYLKTYLQLNTLIVPS